MVEGMSDQRPPEPPDPDQPGPDDGDALPPPPHHEGVPPPPSRPLPPGGEAHLPPPLPPPGGGASYPYPSYPSGPQNPGRVSEYSPTEAIGYGWSKFKDDFLSFLALALLAVVATAVINFIGSRASGGASVVGMTQEGGIAFEPVALVFQILSNIVGVLFMAALVRGAFDATDGNQVSLGAMFTRWDKVQVLLAALVVSVLTTIGLLLLVIPGIIVIFLTWYTTYFVVDRGQDALTAIKSSVVFTGQNLGPVLLYALLGFLCLVAGLLACFVGVFVALPVVVIGAAYTFRRLHDQPVS